MSTKGERIHYLDSVRGIAALMVVFYHFIGWHWQKNVEYHLGSMIFNGSDAVSFFFVLSGFVLSYKYFQRDSELHIKKYVFNRFLRLYPAFIITVLLNYVYWHYGDGIKMLRDVFWYNDRQLWEELLMVRNHHKFYIPGWTLGVEMALSLLMPVLILAGKHNFKLILWFIPLSMIMGPGYISVFTMHFCLGMILAYYYPQIRDYDFSQHKWYRFRWLIYLVIFLLYSLRHIERIDSFGPSYYKFANLLKLDIFHYTGFASFLILIIIINNQKIQTFLNKSPLIFLGKISYSVYLMHWIIVVFIMERWEKFSTMFGGKTLKIGSYETFTFEFIIWLFISIILTIISATAMYYWVEKPFIKLSKRISSKFK